MMLHMSVNNVALYGYVTFIHLLFSEGLGCFYLLAIMNNAPVYICAQVFTWTHVFISFGYIPGGGISGSNGNCIFKLLMSCQAVF